MSLIGLNLKNPSSVCPVSKESSRYSMRGVENFLWGIPPHSPGVKKSFGSPGQEVLWFSIKVKVVLVTEKT